MTHSRRAVGEAPSQLVIAPAWVTAEGAAAYTSLRPEFIKAAFRRGELPVVVVNRYSSRLRPAIRGVSDASSASSIAAVR